MSDERLGSTLFFAALVHGVVILGVTFTAAPLDDEVAAPSLNVTLVLDTEREELAADTAKLLANRDQRGAGQAARGLRPTSTLSADQPVTQAGDPLGADAADGTPRDETPSAEQLVSRGSSDELVPAMPQPTDDPAIDAATRRDARSASRAANDGHGARAASRAARRQRRRAHLDRDAEHAPIRPCRILGRLAAARRTDRHRQLSDGSSWATFARVGRRSRS